MAFLMRAALRLTILSLALLVAACGRNDKPWHTTNITGAMSDLAFSMTRASDGTAVKADDYRGRIVLLYFGYTHCPDVCPATLANLSDVLHKLGPQADRVRVLFVSVDPNRDALPILKEYTHAFGAEVDGLRGTENQIADLARRYRVAYSVKTTPEYVVTHTSAVFVFDDNGHARLVTMDTNDTAGLADDIKRLIG